MMPMASANILFKTVVLVARAADHYTMYQLRQPLTEDAGRVTQSALEDPQDGLTELRGVLMNEHQWRQRTRLDS